MSNLNNFRDYVLANNGGTLSINTGEFNPQTGYMVSIAGAELKIDMLDILAHNSPIQKMDEIIKDYVRTNAEALCKEGAFLGGWIDPSNNLYLDVSICVPTLNEACSLARDNKQLAIFANHTKEVIDINYTEVNDYQSIKQAILRGFKAVKYKDKLITLPKPQTSGTDRQNATYLDMKVNEILNTK